MAELASSLGSFATTSTHDLREQLALMDDARKEMEAELEAIVEELESPGATGAPPAGMSSPLCDAQGFPRADLDLYAVTTKRQRFQVLKNDRKALMLKIEAALHALHAAVRVSQTRGAAPPPSISEKSRATTAFAQVNDVLEGSPASMGGLCSGDLILSFNDVDSSNHRELRALADVVRQNLDRPIQVLVERQGGNCELSVIPKVWSGRGVLGCHFLPC